MLRMDDRGVGQSKGTFKGATPLDFVQDIRAGLAYLRTRPEIDGTRMALLGHSEGAIDAPLVALEEPTLKALVLLAGVAHSLHGTLDAAALASLPLHVAGAVLRPERRRRALPMVS